MNALLLVLVSILVAVVFMLVIKVTSPNGRPFNWRELPYGKYRVMFVDGDYICLKRLSPNQDYIVCLRPGYSWYREFKKGDVISHSYHRDRGSSKTVQQLLPIRQGVFRN